MNQKLKRQHPLHAYKRSDRNEEIYKCLDPYCTHYVNKDFLENKAALCPKCGNEFILTRANLRARIPVCLMCSRSPKKYTVMASEDIVHETLKELDLGDTEETTQNEIDIKHILDQLTLTETDKENEEENEV